MDDDVTAAASRRGAPEPLPRARQAGVLVREVAGETLVYDLDRHRAHCLNATTAAVWRSCDGASTLAEAAAVLRRELGIPADERVVLMALAQLRRARLLEGAPPERQKGAFGRVTRRDLMTRLGLAALSVPLLTTIDAPAAAAAASRPCVPNSQCAANPCNRCHQGNPATQCPGRRCRASDSNCVALGASGCPD